MKATDDCDRRLGVWRRLILRGPAGTFLVRRGVDLKLFGVYVHDITAPDPGLDMHDHPWAFATLILRGGYSEHYAEARTPELPHFRQWRRGSVHRMRQTDIHRIVDVEPGTLTLVVRGRKTRPWGFYQVTEGLWVDQCDYDYESRRPVSEVRS